MLPTDARPALRFYGRRKGRPLNNARAQAMAQLDQFKITLPAAPALLHPQQLLVGKNAYHLEIGFGTGEHLIAQALAQPQVGFLGAEPFVNGLAATMVQVLHHNLTNVRLHPDDARHLLTALAPACLDTIYILFSDPWHKARHAARRFVSPENLARLARVLKTGGRLKLATDDPTLQEWTEAQLGNQSYFAPAPGLFSARPAWPETRYENKAQAAGRTCKYYEYQRL